MITPYHLQTTFLSKVCISSKTKTGLCIMQNESYIVYDLLGTLLAEKQNEVWDQTCWCVCYFSSLVTEVCINNSYAYILAPL